MNSKILANVKRDTEDEKGQIRSSIFLSSEVSKLVKHGRIQNRDLVCEVCSKDFKNMCKTMQEKCFAARREAFELRENLK